MVAYECMVAVRMECHSAFMRMYVGKSPPHVMHRAVHSGYAFYVELYGCIRMYVAVCRPMQLHKIVCSGV